MKPQISKIVSETIGWVGVFLLLLDYLLLTEKIIPVGNEYLVINILGSLALMYVAVAQKARQSFVINLVFILISILPLVEKH